jgi:arylsulfatase A-like enzyme
VRAAPEQVVAISIDGLRPDAISPERTPNLARLRAEGAYTAVAQSLRPTYTNPNHTSMLTGLDPETHGVDFIGEPPDGFVIEDTVLGILRRAGFSTALYLSKHKLRFLAPEGSYDRYVNNPSNADEDSLLAVEGFVEDMEAPASRWDVSFIHLQEPDRDGHAHGWMSDDYLDAVEQSDVYVGQILAALESAGTLEETLVLVTADHGGYERTHSADRPEVKDIPFIARGPEVPQGAEILSPLSTSDVAPTILLALGLAVPPEMEGNPVAELFPTRGVFLRRGDADVDGAVNLTDVVVALNGLFLAGPVPCLLAADVNGDGGMDVSDAVYTVSYLFRDGPEPRPPFPGCGEAADTLLVCQRPCL